ncbi:helix-turn-helix transcriptional regulator [Notoacmeibacter sp. MSK16QG-6]|uniref:helix-turn-helix transcriptional regulator n=1 Tax=Notoacmeibacter sp. MSK16QG-6 TaxID=2957982 RepID=UPI00209ECBBA|nr:autoinducer binding domain-containing protein [Notoacmeibacter sp. MSK16QG-6]MCP1199127.1 autoinducer binding domain-containing protein [Notoacmeibacter sp. MSK16QG-6]
MPYRTFATDDVVDFYEVTSADIAAAPTMYSLLKLMKTIVDFYRWRYFIVLHLPESGDDTLSELTLLTNWDPELIRAYDSHNLAKSSPIFSRMRGTTLPIVYDMKTVKALPESLFAGQLFEKFGHHNGVYFPTVTPNGHRGAVGFGGQREEMPAHESAGLAYLSVQIFERVTQLNMGTQAALGGPRLSEKELDCIRLTASGKTSAETAVLLGTTANTVNHHLASASDKLETLNKAHTVAKSLRLGLID